MNIGVIGAGGMGRCLASKFVKLGHTVSIANSRGPASLRQLADEIGAEPVRVEKAAENKNVIIVSIPQKNIPDLSKDIFNRLAEGVVVIDTGNYYPNLRDGAITALDQSGIDSLWVQQQLGIPVAKVFNSILAESLQNLGRPRGDNNRIAMAVSGDDKRGKEVVFNLVEDLGFDPFDIGSIGESWKQQPGSPIYCRDINLAELNRRVDTMRMDWTEMRDMILAKRKADEVLMQADYAAYLKILRD